MGKKERQRDDESCCLKKEEVRCTGNQQSDEDLCHDPSVCDRDAKSLQASFPLMNNQICDMVVLHLAKYPEITSNDNDLYAGYVIQDLATQWAFWDHTSSKSWCTLPEFTFTLLNGNPNYSTNTKVP